MARNTRSSRLEGRSARLKLPIRGKPYWIKIADGLSLGYRRNASAGSWSMRVADGRGGNWVKTIGTADDFDDGAMSFWDAQAKARELHRGAAHEAGKLITVNEAIEAYAADLLSRGGEPGNVSWINFHLTPTLGSKLVAQLNARELRVWRDGLLGKGLAPASVTRVCKSLHAALSLAAAHDPRIGNANAWRIGLAALPDSNNSRNVILTDDQVRKVVAAAYSVGPAFGLLAEVCATTGSRPVQARRLVVADAQRARLMMPSSKKGKGKRRIDRKPVPIPEALALRLKAAGKGRDPEAPLLLKEGGTPWEKTNQRDPMREAAKRAGLDPNKVTMYALRHSSIVRQLLKGIPVRVVADQHDTSVAMIEKTYSKYISDHSDELVRGALLDLGEPAKGNVVALR